MADSGFTALQVQCRLSARWLTFNRATKMRGEGLGLRASIRISAPSTHRPCGQFRCPDVHSSDTRHHGESRGTGGEDCAPNPSQAATILGQEANVPGLPGPCG